MGEGGAAIIGGVVGALVGGGAGFKSGYQKRDSELQPIILRLQQDLSERDRQLSVKDQQLLQMAEELRTKNAKIAELERHRDIPVLSEIRKKLGGSQA